jgi:hypothetical protein
VAAGLAARAEGLREGLRLPARDLVIAHLLVHGLHQHLLAPESYPQMRMVADLVDLGFSREELGRKRQALAGRIGHCVDGRLVAAAVELAEMLQAGEGGERAERGGAPGASGFLGPAGLGMTSDGGSERAGRPARCSHPEEQGDEGSRGVSGLSARENRRAPGATGFVASLGPTGGGPRDDAGVLLGHILAGAFDAAYARSLRWPALLEALRASSGRQRALLLWHSVVLTRGQVDKVYGGPRSALGYLGLRVWRPFDMMLRALRYGAAWARARAARGARS